MWNDVGETNRGGEGCYFELWRGVDKLRLAPPRLAMQGETRADGMKKMKRRQWRRMGTTREKVGVVVVVVDVVVAALRGTA